VPGGGGVVVSMAQDERRATIMEGLVARRFAVPPTFKDRAGFRYACYNRHGQTPTWKDGSPYVVVYEAGEAGLDTSGGRWVTVCEAHGSLVNHDRLDTARHFSHEPETWCDDCRLERDAIRQLVASIKEQA